MVFFLSFIFLNIGCLEDSVSSFSKRYLQSMNYAIGLMMLGGFKGINSENIIIR